MKIFFKKVIKEYSFFIVMVIYGFSVLMNKESDRIAQILAWIVVIAFLLSIIIKVLSKKSD